MYIAFILLSFFLTDRKRALKNSAILSDIQNNFNQFWKVQYLDWKQK